MPARPSPPPLKKAAAPPPQPPKRAMRAVGTASVDAVDDSMNGPTLPPVPSQVRGPSPAAVGDDAASGEWLFKQKDMVLGPVTAIVLVEKIKAGELGADTPVARDGQPFQPMKLVGLFREAYEGFVEQQRREQEEREYNAAVTKARVLRALLIAVIVLVPALAGAVVGHVMRLWEPWNDTSSWIAKAPPLVDLPPRPSEVVRTSAPGTGTKKADAGESAQSDDEPGEKNDKNDKDDKNDREPRVARKGKAERGGGGAPDKADAADDKGSDKGVVKELTNEQAIAPLKDVKGALGACFKAELEANEDMPSQLVLSYTITEEGRSANVELTNRELRGRPVQDCVKKALATARWPRFEGERKNVTVPFNIKKPPKPAGGPVSGGAPK